MSALNRAVITDAARVAAAAWAKRVIPGLAVPLDGIAGLVARLLDAPIGAISVIGADYDDCIGAHGLPAPLSRQVPLRYSVCKYVVGTDHPLAVADMIAHPQMRRNPAVWQFGIRSFAGVPLRDTGDHVIGALTVVDYQARQWSAQQLATLVEVATLIAPIPDVLGESDLRMLTKPDGARPELERSGAVHAQVHQSFLTALLDSLQVGVLAVDAHGEPVLFNRTLRQIYAIPPELPVAEAAALAARQLHHLDGRPKQPQETALHRALAGAHVRDMPAALIAPGLPRRELLTNSEPIHGPDGQLLGAVSAVLDVTERHRAEQFRDAELRIATVLNRAPTIAEAAPAVVAELGALLGSSYMALWLVDPVGEVLRQAAHWTTPGLIISDLLPEHITATDAGPGRVWATGQPLLIPDLSASADHATGPARAFALACRDRGLHALMALPVLDGNTVLGVLSCLSSQADANSPQLIGMLSGIAAQISGFLIRRRAAELSAQLATAKEDFIAMVGHAVRTPLTSIHTLTELLHEDENQPAETRELLGIVLRNAEALRGIVNDLLDVAALEAGQDSLDLAVVDLTEMVHDAIRTARPAAATNRVTLTSDLPDRLLLTADPTRLRQLLDNLLNNAIKYSPHGTVRVSARRQDTMIELIISDNGIGIPAEQRHRVFDRFFRADNVAHGTTTGTGLGLTLVRAIAHAHGGTAHLADQQPGATIVVHLPAPDHPTTT